MFASAIFENIIDEMNVIADAVVFKKKTVLSIMMLFIISMNYPFHARASSQVSHNIFSSGIIIYPINDYALNFNGINDYVEIPNSESLDIYNEITIEFWLKFTAVPDSWNGIITKWEWSESGFPGYYVITNKDKCTLIFGLFANDGSGTSKEYYTMEVGLNEWHYYAFTYDGSNIRGFLDGRLHISYSFSKVIGINSLPLTIGCRSNMQNFFRGAIDEVHISKISRSTNEIWTNYNNGKIKKLEVDEYTVALWHFNEGFENNVYDETENNNDGIIHNAKWIPEGIEEEKNVNVYVDYEKRIGTNDLFLGVQFHDWMGIQTKLELTSKAEKCNFKLVRIFLDGGGGFKTCQSWDEQTQVGIYDWEKLDTIIQTIKDIGAQPLICIGGGSSESYYWLPPGMVGDWNGTGFPFNNSFCKYAEDIVKHVNIEKGWNVKYWEIWNEPHTNDVLGNPNRLTSFTTLFNNAEKCMHEVDPTILCGTDASNFVDFLNYFVDHAEGVGFLSFHKYDAGSTWWYPNPEGYISDYLALKMAGEIVNYPWNPARYSPREMQERWNETHSIILPVICSETNLNWICGIGTDPRIQEIIGATWYAEELRFFILNNVSYSVYFDFTSDEETEGWDFGMVKEDAPYTEWYPYLVNHLIGRNISIGAPIFESFSNNTDAITTLTWKEGGEYKLLLICKVNRAVKINITGLPVEEAIVYRIDDSNTKIQSEFTSVHHFSINGYTILLISFPYSG